MSLAAAFAAASSLDALQFSARAMGANVVARRSVWLRGEGDSASIACLVSFPFKGEKLFGKVLEPHLVEGKDKKKVLPLGRKKSAKRQQTFHSQGFSFCSKETSRDLGPDGIKIVYSPDQGTPTLPISLPIKGPKTSPQPDSQLMGRPLPVGARLLAFADCWREITSDAWVLQMVRLGYALKFAQIPRNHFWKVPFFRDPIKHSRKMEAIAHILEIRAIELVPVRQRGTRVYSVFFLVSKTKRTSSG